MCELPPAGPPFIEGLSTAEARWILPGQLHAAVAAWFGRFAGGLEEREDVYLIDPVLRGVSVKIRAGRALEVKQYHGSQGILDAGGRARGRIESWRKWSFPLGPPDPYGAGRPGWAVVHKRRRMSQFRLVRGRLMADVTERAAVSACAVELTEIRLGGEAWWSLGFEATGPADLLCRTLQATAGKIFAQVPPGDVGLEMSHCQSYAEWLSRHWMNPAIHAREEGDSRRADGRIRTGHAISPRIRP